MSIGITANVNAYATADRTMTTMTTRRHNGEISDRRDNTTLKAPKPY